MIKTEMGVARIRVVGKNLAKWGRAVAPCVAAALVPAAVYGTEFNNSPTEILREAVAGTITATRGRNARIFKWRYAFDAIFRDNRIQIELRVNPVRGRNVTVRELQRATIRWREGVDKIWNNRFALEMPNGARYPIMVETRFSGLNAHHNVIIRPGIGRSDELNWNVGDPQHTAAHEVGHMLGAYDEYAGGAQDPRNPIIGRQSIMTGRPEPGVARSHHFRKIRDWFADRTGIPGLRIVQIKE